MIRTLHVDIEGGWGGSSRSLFELIKRLDRTHIAPMVAHRQAGPVTERYRAIDVPTVHLPEIASFAPRPRKSARILLANLPRLMALPRLAATLTEIVRRERIAAVHLNYEGLFLLARRLRRRMGDLPLLCHSRTHIPADAWGRWAVRSLIRDVDHMFFISEMEDQRFRRLAGGATVAGDVLWNIAADPLPRRPLARPPEAVFLGNVDPAKGADRMVEIAAALESIGAPPLRLAVYGDARSRPGYGDALRNAVDQRRLAHRIAFRGHTRAPEDVLAGAFALVRPSRSNDPWGRDVIEATSFGVPVLATGRYEGVIQHGVNGFLFEPFDATAIARSLVALLRDPGLWSRLSEAGLAKGRARFAGEEQAALFTAVLDRLVPTDTPAPECAVREAVS